MCCKHEAPPTELQEFHIQYHFLHCCFLYFLSDRNSLHVFLSCPHLPCSISGVDQRRDYTYIGVCVLCLCARWQDQWPIGCHDQSCSLLLRKRLSASAELSVLFALWLKCILEELLNKTQKHSRNTCFKST